MLRFWSPLFNKQQQVQMQASTNQIRAVVFELFRASNRTYAHRNLLRRRTRQRRHLLKSTSQEIYPDEDEREECPFNEPEVDETPPLGSESSAHRMARSGRKGNKGNKPDKPKRSSSSRITYDGPEPRQRTAHGTLGQWQVLGGDRISDLDIHPFFVKVPIGLGKERQEYYMHIDTGSGISWVNCKGRGPITTEGPHGLFKPKADSYVNCKKQEEFCKGFQDGEEHRCDKKHHFRCIFDTQYGDGLIIEGYIVMIDLIFDLSDGSESQADVAFGCADKVNDEETKKLGQNTALTDGLIGLGPHPGSWLHQLNMLGYISEYVIAICFEPDLGKSRHAAIGPELPEPAGFLSFGNPYSAQAESTIWTANIPSPEEYYDAMYTGRLVSIRYRDIVIQLRGNEKKRKRDHPEGVQMGFDTGSDLTYLTRKTFDAFVTILDEEAKHLGYEITRDADEFVKDEQRKCWRKKSGGEEPSVEDFGDMILEFATFAEDDTKSELVINPKYYITSEGSGRQHRTCFNMLKETEFDFGNLGAEVMRGHLLLFDNELNRIGWRRVDSCSRVL